MPISEVHLIDCMEFMKDIPDKFFELAIVDPPYGMEKGSMQGKGKLKNRILNVSDNGWDIAPNEKYFKELFRISNNQIIWGGNYFELPGTRCFLIWDKKQYLTTFSRCEYAWTSFYAPAKIFEYNYQGGKIHPTQKPIALYKWLLRNYAKPGDKIFDSHMGSQSSRIACYDGGFDFWGCELDKDYFEAGCKRFDNHIKQMDLFTDNSVQLSI